MVYVCLSQKGFNSKYVAVAFKLTFSGKQRQAPNAFASFDGRYCIKIINCVSSEG